MLPSEIDKIKIEEAELAGRNKIKAVKKAGWGYKDIAIVEVASKGFTPPIPDNLFDFNTIERNVDLGGQQGDYIVPSQDIFKTCLHERNSEKKNKKDNQVDDCTHIPVDTIVCPLKKGFFGDRRQIAFITGKRYWFCQKLITCYEYVTKFQNQNRAIRITPPQALLPVVKPLKTDPAFVMDLTQRSNIEVSTADEDRLFHSHGHTVEEMFALRHGRIARLPDCVVYPKTHGEVLTVVKAALKHDVAIIPFGGGTSVTLGVCAPTEEPRMIATVNLTWLNKINWIDKESMCVSVGAGAVGEILEKRLALSGLTIGHEPDSRAFSTVGGWISTRCSGMKKNTYGNIEDILLGLTVVLANGDVLETHPGWSIEHGSSTGSVFPRVSAGLDLKQFFLGSEGCYGIITNAILKVRPVPEVSKFSSMLFPTLENGIGFLRDVALKRAQPTSIRLLDNTQLQLGLNMRPLDVPEDGSFIRKEENLFSSDFIRNTFGRAARAKTNFVESMKKFLLFNVKGFSHDTFCACTLLYEGSAVDVAHKETVVCDLAKKHGGVNGGEETGRSGYLLTFMIAYIRDFLMDYGWIFESFETSVPWANVSICIDRVKRRIQKDCEILKLQYPPVSMVRIAQTYDEGACLYFYFGFFWPGLYDPIKAYGLVEDGARDEIMKSGGCISHHHGIGKLRKKFMRRHLGTIGKHFKTRVI